MVLNDDNVPIDVTKPKLEKFRGNDKDALDIKTWCLQVTRLDTVNKLGDVNTAMIVMEALREQALSWALLLQDEKPVSAASWLLLKPLLIERFDKAVNETQKFKLIAALQQRQHESAKDFLDRCKTAWYGLLRRLRTTYTEDIERKTHDQTRNECIKCMYICGLRNDVRMAVESIAGNTLTLETALEAAVQYESALVTGSGHQKQGGAQRYGVAALTVKGDETAAAAASSQPNPAGMHEMKAELAAISARRENRQAARQAGQPQDAQQPMQWDRTMQGTGSSATTADSGASTLRPSVRAPRRSVTSSHLELNCRHREQRGTLCLTQTKQPASYEHDFRRQRVHQQEKTISA